MNRELLQQALDALKLHLTHHEHGCVYLNPVMYALEKELAKPNEFYPDWDMLKPYHERIKELEAQLAKHKIPTKIFGPNLEEILNAAGFYRPEQETYAYAKRLAEFIWEKHFQKESPDWKPLENTLGVLTQIDNMTCVLEKAKPEHEPFKPDWVNYRQGLADGAAQPEQEPVAWIYDWYGYKSQSEAKELVKDWIASVYSEVSDPTIGAHNIRPLYAAPPRKPWVWLTDDEVKEAWGNTPMMLNARSDATRKMFACAIEAKLKEKNT
jgi:hypothetical protein